MITITAPARLHICLISMNSNGYRRNGGLGFAISGFDTKIEIKEDINNSVAILCEDNKQLETEITDLLNHIVKRHNLGKKVSIQVIKKPLSHNGLGTGTTTKLECIEGLFELNAVSVTREELISLSTRGGTSGIGINTYFTGGYVFDAGRKTGGIKPSHEFNGSSFDKPLKITQGKMPDWDINIIRIKDCKKISREEESEFFNNKSNIKNSEVYEACYHAVFGCLCSFMESDISTFEDSLNSLQNTAWKKGEWELQDKRLIKCREYLSTSGINVALSSLGTTMFSVRNNKTLINQLLKEIQVDADIKTVKPNNIGRVIEIV